MANAVPPRSYDAVIVVPGIMGSRLRDTTTNRLVWGATATLRYTRLTKGAFETLKVTDEERAGKVGRIVPDGLLSTPGWAPVLRGFDPYRDLVSALEGAVVDKRAVRPFAYD